MIHTRLTIKRIVANGMVAGHANVVFRESLGGAQNDIARHLDWLPQEKIIQLLVEHKIKVPHGTDTLEISVREYEIPGRPKEAVGE